MNSAFNQTFYKLVDVNSCLLIIHTFKYSDGGNISWMPFFFIFLFRLTATMGFYEPGIAVINLQPFWHFHAARLALTLCLKIINDPWLSIVCPN